MLTVGSLFAGIGGIELGLERTGYFRTIWQVENDDYCKKVLEKNWPKVARFGDIRKCRGMADAISPRDRMEEHRSRGQEWESAKTHTSKVLRQKNRASCSKGADTNGRNVLGYCDLICGGFPCQDISTAGKREGIRGKRSGLWFEMARLVSEIRPRYVLVENVSALLTRGIETVLGDLASFGYHAEWDCIPASAIGAPHRRDRVFIVAYDKCISGEVRRSNLQDEKVSGTRKDNDRRGRTDDIRKYDSEKDENMVYTKHNGHENGYKEARGEVGQGEQGRMFKPSGTGDVADTERGNKQGESYKRQEQGELGRPCSNEDVSDTQCIRSEAGMAGQVKGQERFTRIFKYQGVERFRNENSWTKDPAEEDPSAESFVGRVAHGIPQRVDRLKCLGNAVVPQVAEHIGRCIMEFDKKRSQV